MDAAPVPVRHQHGHAEQFVVDVQAQRDARQRRRGAPERIEIGVVHPLEHLRASEKGQRFGLANVVYERAHFTSRQIKKTALFSETR